MEDQKSKTLGTYQLLRRLARGGMSEVYLVLDERDDQLYALKLMRQQSEEDCQRFQQEVHVLMGLQHPHILPILDTNVHDDDLCYYVMPYVDHGTLKERLKKGSLSTQETERVLGQVADALHFLHQQGFVHRDVKPSNILLDETGSVWLADFGLVRSIDGGSDLTRTGYMLGTPAYMAPELEKKPASIPSDVYALGIVLYEMLTGQVPFIGETLLDVYLKHAYELPPLPSALNLQLSPVIDQVITRALAKQPAERYASPQELAEAYREALRLEQNAMSVTEDFPQLEMHDTEVVPQEEAQEEAPAPVPLVVPEKQKRRREKKMPLTIGGVIVLAVLALSLVGMGVVSHNGLTLLALSPVHAFSLAGGNGSPTSLPSPEKTGAITTPSITPTPASSPTSAPSASGVPTSGEGASNPPAVVHPTATSTPGTSSTKNGKKNKKNKKAKSKNK